MTLYDTRDGRLLQGEAALDAEALEAELDERFYAANGCWPWEVEDGE